MLDRRPPRRTRETMWMDSGFGVFLGLDVGPDRTRGAGEPHRQSWAGTPPRTTRTPGRRRTSTPSASWNETSATSWEHLRSCTGRYGPQPPRCGTGPAEPPPTSRNSPSPAQPLTATLPTEPNRKDPLQGLGVVIVRLAELPQWSPTAKAGVSDFTRPVCVLMVAPHEVRQRRPESARAQSDASNALPQWSPAWWSDQFG